MRCRSFVRAALGWPSSLLVLLLLVVSTILPCTVQAQEAAAVALLQKMVAVAADNGDGQRNGEVDALKQRIAALPKPSHGDGKGARAANALGLAAFHAGQFEQAKQDFIAAQKADPADVEITANLGFVYIRLGDLASAGQAVFTALALAPGRSATWANLGEYYALKSQLREAVACYVLAFHFSPDQAATRRFLQKLSASDNPNVRQATQLALQTRLIQGDVSPGLPASTAATPPVPASQPFPLSGGPELVSPSLAQEQPPPSPAAVEPAPPFPETAQPVTPAPVQETGVVSAAPPAATAPALDATVAKPDASAAPQSFLERAKGFLLRWWKSLLLFVFVLALSCALGLSFYRQRLSLYLHLLPGFLERLGNGLQRLHSVSAPQTAQARQARFRVRWLRRLLIALWGFILFTTLVSLAIDLGALTQDYSPPAIPDAHCESPSSDAKLSQSEREAQWNNYHWCQYRAEQEEKRILLAYQHRIESTFLYRFFGARNFDVAVSYLASLGGVNFVFDLWVLAALVFFASVWRRRTAGSTAKPSLKWIILATLLVLGRPWTWFWSLWLALLPGFWGLALFKYALFPPFLLLVFGSTTLISLYFGITAAALAVVVFPVKVFQAILNIQQQVSFLKAIQMPVIGSLGQFYLWFTGRDLLPSTAPDESKGARFATPQEIAAAIKRDGTAFGFVDGQPLTLKTEKHVLIMASTRSGKGTSLIIPHLLTYPGSAFVLDPKGENARVTGGQREKLNRQVHYLDPFGITGKPTSRFNPLTRFTPDNMEAESKALAAALVIGERDHWTASAQQLLAAVILHVFASDNIPPEEKDLRTVRRLLLSGIKEALADMLESEVADGLLAALAASFVATPEKELGSIISTAQRETEILDNPFLIACLSATGADNEVDFAAWHRDAMTVYLCLSAPKFPVFNRWLRLVLTSALDEMTDQLKPPPLPVCFMLDELATLGHLGIVENAVGLAAGYGVQLWTVWQDIGQLRDAYKQRWPSFFSNSGVRCAFSVQDYDTADYLSKTLGGRLVTTTSQQQDIYGLTKGQSQSETLRPLLASDKIISEFSARNLTMLVLAEGLRPFVAQRVPYYHNTALDGLWDPPEKRGPDRKAGPDKRDEEAREAAEEKIAAMA